MRLSLIAFLGVVAAIALAACTPRGKPQEASAPKETPQENAMADPYKEKLTAEQYYICREKGTEAPGSGKYDKHYEKGTYKCVACGQELFTSDAKYDSKSGWPSYFQPVSKQAVREEADNSHGWKRTEVMCSKCGSHLGHVFDDGPKPTGLRYCINSVALEFVAASKPK